MAKVYSPADVFGSTSQAIAPTSNNMTGESKPRTRGEAISIVAKFERAEGGQLSRAKRQEMIQDLMNGATFEIEGLQEGGGGSAPTVPDPGAPTTIEKKAPKVYAAADVFGAQAAGNTPDGKMSWGEFGDQMLESVTSGRVLEPIGDAASKTWDAFKKRWQEGGVESREAAARIGRGELIEYWRTGGTDEQKRLAAEEKLALAEGERFQMTPEEVEQTRPGMLASLKNPLDLLLNDSIPANFLEWQMRAPAQERQRFMEARKIAMQENILANPQQFPDVAVQAALSAQTARKVKQDPSVAAMWDALKKQAINDPGKTGAMFVNALLADPYMLAVPAGMGLRPIEGTRKLATGAETTGRVARAADSALDAATLGAGLNVAAAGMEQASTGAYNADELKMAAAMGAVIGGPLGALFGTGKPPTKLTPADSAKLDAAIDATINGKASTVAETNLTPDQVVALQKQWREQLGIKSDKEAADWKKKREREVRGAFKDNADYADYLAALDQERLDMETRAAAREAEGEAAALEQRRGPGVEVSPRSPAPDAGRPEVLEALDTPAFLRTAEQNVVLKEAGLRDAPGGDVGAPDNAAVIQALRKPPFQRTAEERIAIQKSSLGKNQSGKIDPKLMTAMGISATGAAIGAATYPKDRIKGATLGAILTPLLRPGLRTLKGSSGGRILSHSSQEGAIKLKGGNWTENSVFEITPYTDNMDMSSVGDHIITQSKRYLNKFAGTADDPLKDIRLADGSSDTWGKLMDEAIGQEKTPNKYGEFLYDLAYEGDAVPVLKSLEETGVTPRVNITERAINASTKIRRFMIHVSDYLDTLSPEVIKKMSFADMVKGTKRWDAELARKMKDAKVKFLENADKVEVFPDGFAWIQLNKPGQFANESDLMGHSVRGYEPPERYVTEDDWMSPEKSKPHPDWRPDAVGGQTNYGFGGWDAIKSGDARVYSLRKPDGSPVATVEVGRLIDGSLIIEQIKGPRNNTVDPQYLDKIYRLIGKLNEAEFVSIEGGGGRYDLDNVLERASRTGNQSGKASPEFLARTAVVAGAGAAAYALSPEEDKIKNTLLGVLAGIAVPAGGTVFSRFRQAGAVAPDGSLNWLPDSLRLPDEPAVVARAQAGDQQAFAALYKQYAPRLAKTMKKYMRDAGPRLGVDAEDLVQEAFVKAFNNIKEFEGKSGFYTWLYKIATNEAKNKIDQSLRRVDTRSMFNAGGAGEPGSLAAGHILEGDTPLVRGDVEARAATLDTPENLAVADEVDAQLRAAFAKLPKDQQEAITLHYIEGMSRVEIAEQLGIPTGTVDARISRGKATIDEALAKGYGAKKVPKGQRGEIDPKLLKGAALAGTGAVIGASLNEENPLAGAGVGAAVALTGRAALPGIAKMADTGLGVVSTRIKNISPALHHRAITLERRLLENTQRALDKVDPFLVKLNRLPGDMKELINRAILTNDPNVTNNLLRELGDTKLLKDWQEVRSVLDSFRDKLIEMGRFKQGITEYFPRIVKDYEGLLGALGKEHRSYLDKIIKEANDASIKNSGKELTDIERSIIINKAMQALLKPGGQPGFAKRRVIEDVPPELQKFYATPTESLHSYIRAAVQDIEMAKFFGKDLKNVVKEGKTYTNIDASIGNVVERLLKENKITADQAMEVSSLLKSRFTGGMKGSNEIIQTAKNLGNAGLLGNVVSAVTQFGDTIIQAYVQDIGSAIQAAARSIVGKQKLKMETFGLATHIAEEFVSTTKSAKFLNKMFKYGLFSAVDKFGKNVALNAAIIRHQKLAKTAGGIKELERKYGEALGEEFPQLIEDLKAGKETDLTRGLAFAELSRSQPITRLELPQAYLDNPNGRVLYWLKTFMIKQIDLARRDGYNEIKKGNVVKGTRNLLELGLALGIAGTTTDRVKEFLKEAVRGNFDPKILADIEASDIPMNMLKTFGWSDYTIKTATGGDSGKAQPIKALLDQATPPYRMMEEIIRADPKALRYIPLVGPFIAPKKEEKRDTYESRQRRQSYERKKEREQ